MELIEETEQMVKKIGKPVAWVGSLDGKYAISWVEFLDLGPIEYDSNYGVVEVAVDLVVVFEDNTFMYRGRCGGTEWWEYLLDLPQKQPDAKPFSRIIAHDGVKCGENRLGGIKKIKN